MTADSCGEVLGPGEVEPAGEPGRVVDEVLEEHRPALGDGVVAEPPELDRGGRGDVREMLRVPSLVEERVPVVGAAHRLDHEHYPTRHFDRRAEGARALARARIEVEVDVLLRAQVDAEPVQRPLERRDHAVAGEALVPVAAAETRE